MDIKQIAGGIVFAIGIGCFIIPFLLSIDKRIRDRPGIMDNEPVCVPESGIVQPHVEKSGNAIHIHLHAGANMYLGSMPGKNDDVINIENNNDRYQIA